MIDFLLDIRNDLDTTASSSNDGYTFPVQRIAFFIRSRMHELTLVVFDAGNVWPLEIVQDATCVDEELGFVIDNTSTGQIADLELPNAFRCIPLRMFDLMLEFNVLVDEVVFFVDAFEVFEDLW